MTSRPLADRERLLGPDHPNTLTSRNNLAARYRAAGRPAEALSSLEQALADCERLLGPDHPDTLTARANLAVSYGRWGAPARPSPSSSGPRRPVAPRRGIT